MSGVKDRLRRLTGETPKPSSAPPSETINELRRRIDAVVERRPKHSFKQQAPLPEIASALSGEEVEAAGGRCWFIRCAHDARTTHGDARLGDLVRPDMTALGLLADDGRLAGYDLHDALFLDTETTGLAGGTGTLAFLVGLGWFEGDDFITVQLLARDYDEEAAVLALVSEEAARRRFLVTFNGRAFDVNLLSARFILNRMNDPLKDMPHLDLLAPSRRFYSGTLPNCRLVTLEEHVLGLKRHGDVPGAEIPARYFAWLRRRDPALLTDIIEHNRLDIVSMAALAHHLAACLEDDTGLVAERHGAARLLLARGETAAAVTRLESLAAEPDVTVDVLVRLSLLHKRAGRWDEATALWERLLADDACNLFAAEELAKWAEHRAKDPSRALAVIMPLLNEPLRFTPDQRAALEHRRARLERKLAARDRAPR